MRPVVCLLQTFGFAFLTSLLRHFADTIGKLRTAMFLFIRLEAATVQMPLAGYVRILQTIRRASQLPGNAFCV